MGQDKNALIGDSRKLLEAESYPSDGEGVAVSVIISTRNRDGYLPDSLRLLAAQECDVPFEIIVIDNGSTDGTSRLLEAWCGRDRRFRTANEPRLGLSCGKNAGIRLARAPLLLFTDDDTLPDVRWVQSYVDFFARHPAAQSVVGGAIVPIPHDLKDWPHWFHESALPELALLDHRGQRRLYAPEYVWGANMAGGKCLFERHGPFDETIGRKGDERGTFEDTEFQDRVRKAGGDVWFCPSAVVRHRIPRQTITPRRISATAFTRGRNSFWLRHIPVWREAALVPQRNAVKVLLLLTVSLCRWSLLLIAFRMRPNRSTFERLHRAVFVSGHILDSLRAGRTRRRLPIVVTYMVHRVQRLFLRLSPDTPL